MDEDVRDAEEDTTKEIPENTIEPIQTYYAHGVSFKMIGGANSQLYIYINQIQTLKNIISAPGNYKNKLLQSVSDRHLISVNMLTYLYENDFSSEERWNIIENYFLGQIPDSVKRECLKVNPEMSFE